MDVRNEKDKWMTKLDCAVRLLWCLRFLDSCNSEDVEAFAKAIMELGRNEEDEDKWENAVKNVFLVVTIVNM